jgi:hypothetical protein
MVRNLSWYGRAPFEILRDAENGCYSLAGFTPRRLFNFGWWWVQLIPRKDQVHWKRRFTILPKQQVWFATIPKVLGGVADIAEC